MIASYGYGRGSGQGLIASYGYGRNPLLLVLSTAIKRIKVLFNQAVRVPLEW